ncbi:DUF4012 domain-containing protein [Georgenia muralis]
MTAWDARTAYVALRASAKHVQSLENHVRYGNREAAAQTASSLRQSTATAREALDGPHWDLARQLPVVGDDVRTVQAVSAVVDDLAADALGPLMEAAELLDPERIAPVEGRIDLEPFQVALPKIRAADEAVSSAKLALQGIRAEGLIRQLGAPVAELTEQMDQVGEVTATATRAMQLIPPMMGAEGRREYVLLVQNNSEPRATGGLAGTYVLITAERGVLALAEQRSAASIGGFSEPVLDLTRAERGLYGTQLGRYPGNVTSTPDFPRTAQLVREVWRRETGNEVDGVLSIDPVGLGIFLGATGQVKLPTGHNLTAENAAPLLLNQVYVELVDPQAQDAFFASAAEAIFGAVLSRPIDPPAVIEALHMVTGQGRLMLWSAAPEEQALIKGTALSGELRGEVDDSPLVGIYVHDTSGAKIAYYQHVDAEVAGSELRPDGSQLLSVEVTISSHVPTAIASLPPLLTGGGIVVPAGTIRSEISVYAPAQGRIVTATSSDPDSRSRSHIHNGLMVGTTVVTLEPGESVDLEFTVESGAGQLGDPMARITPGPDVDQFVVRTSPYLG